MPPPCGNGVTRQLNKTGRRRRSQIGPPIKHPDIHEPGNGKEGIPPTIGRDGRGKEGRGIGPETVQREDPACGGEFRRPDHVELKNIGLAGPRVEPLHVELMLLVRRVRSLPLYHSDSRVLCHEPCELLAEYHRLCPQHARRKRDGDRATVLGAATPDQQQQQQDRQLPRAHGPSTGPEIAHGGSVPLHRNPLSLKFGGLMSAKRLAMLTLTILAGCGGERGTTLAADSLSRDLQRVPVDSSAVLNDRPADMGGAKVVQASAPAPKPVSKPKPKPQPRPAPPAPKPEAPASLLAGTTLATTIDREITSRTTKPGETVTATVASDVKDNHGRVVIPAGAKVNLTVTEIHESENKGDKTGKLTLTPNEVESEGK